ncbi:MAG: SurA N-terminal domain-containing protein [Parabacteroides sp.]|nr:SurA N-terminal domain-containing protein [Parabacteroides sp.]
MATLEKIRNKAGLLILVVGIALFAFIIGDFLRSGSTYFRQSQEVIGKIDGNEIKIHDYNQRVDEMAEMYKMQSGQNSLPEEYMTQIRESVFQNIVRDTVMAEETGKLGLTVTPEELFDMVQGENISPVLLQMQIFVNPETGTFDKTALLDFLKRIEGVNEASPADLIQEKNFWLFWEKSMKQQRLEQKYTTLLSKAIVANPIDAKDAFESAAVNSDIAYVMQSYASVPDSTVSVSKSEVEKRYNERKELYKQKEAKVIKYIAVDIVPSQEDYDNVSNEIEGIKDEFKSSANVADLVNEYSEVPYMDVYFSLNAFDPDLKQFAATAQVGDVHGPVFADNKYRMFKLVDKIMAPDSVKVSHIMLAGSSAAATAALADSLKNELKKGADFAALAGQYSMDRSAQNGGELGWFTEATALRGVGADFRDAVFSAPLNEVVEVKSNYGTHLVKITGKTANVNKYKVADIDMSVSPSSKTYSKIYNELNQFLTKNGTAEKIESGAKEAGYNILTNVTVTADNQTLGNIKNSRQVIRWAFKEDKGALSDIFECDDKFVVAAVQGTLKEGYRSLNAVKPQLEAEIRNEKKGDMIASALASKGAVSLDQYAGLTNSKVDTVKFVNFDTRRITGIGIEPKLNGYIAVAEVNKLSEPVKGNNGVYVFEVYNREKDAREYNEADEIKSLEAANAYRYSYQVIQELVDNADVKDTRIRYY